MGAMTFEHLIETTRDIYTEFMNLKEQARLEYGDNAYNGTISNTNLSTKYYKKNSNKYTKKYEKQVFSEVDEDCIYKGTTYVYDLGIVGYEVTTVTYEVMNLQKPKFGRRYIVPYKRFYRDEYTEICCTTKSEAKEQAIKKALEGYSVANIREDYILLEGENRIGKVLTSKKVVKNEPKKLKANQSLKEIHKYYFVGVSGY